MKIAILILIFLTINAMGQSNLPIAQTIIYNSDGIDKPLSMQQFQYNLNGQQVGVSQYNWNAKQQKWTLTWMEEKEFDQGNEVISKGWVWKRYPDSLKNYSIRTQTSNKQQQLIYSSWFSQDTYDNGEVHSRGNKNTYFYNSNGCKVKEETDHSYDNNKDGFKSSTSFIVNANCQILESLYNSNLSVPSAGQQLNRYEYDNGLLSLELGYTIQIDTIQYFENIFRYNQNGLLILKEQNRRERTYIDYAPNGKENHYRLEYLPDNNTKWTPISESFLTFNGNLLKKTEYYQNWNLSGEFWEYVSMEINYFDNLGEIDSLESTQYQVTPRGSALVSKERHNYIRRCDGLEIEIIVNRTSVYEAPEKFTTHITYARPADCEQVRANPLVIFPNPTQGWTTIVLSESTQSVVVRIFSDNGQLEKSYTFSNGINPIRLDLSDLSSGIHTVQVSNGTSITSSHIIIL